AIIAAFLLYWIASGKPGYDLATNGLASNGVGEHSPGKYSMGAGFVAEVVLTCFFLLIIMGSTHRQAPVGFAPIAIGLGLTLIHLISIPITNTSVNPARSTGPALVELVGGNGLAFSQLWIFWVAPIIGGAIGGWAYRSLIAANDIQVVGRGG
ncbi:MAG: aquaporin, partial [Proteobacteria bacterium]|nr:aquaporin [Pseudomonadota bacterium]